MDESVRMEVQSQASCGDVVRDASGAWKGGFARNIGIGSMLGMELWGIYSALLIA
ncbi:hypothetical protein SESBI_27022 [Sesbania bispinosa]|nr:hypothetical protein SESBI_27022 [Sesbania bispinosa]